MFLVSSISFLSFPFFLIFPLPPFLFTIVSFSLLFVSFSSLLLSSSSTPQSTSSSSSLHSSLLQLISSSPSPLFPFVLLMFPSLCSLHSTPLPHTHFFRAINPSWNSDTSSSVGTFLLLPIPRVWYRVIQKIFLFLYTTYTFFISPAGPLLTTHPDPLSLCLSLSFSTSLLPLERQ